MENAQDEIVMRDILIDADTSKASRVVIEEFCEFLHDDPIAAVSSDVEKNDNDESNDVTVVTGEEEGDGQAAEPSSKDTTDSTVENMDKLELNEKDLNEVKELESHGGDMFDNEKDGYLILEKAIASGI